MKLAELWNIKKIVGIEGNGSITKGGLKSLNPNYFPKVYYLQIVATGQTTIFPECLTEAELFEYYDLCGKFIHPESPFREPLKLEIWDKIPILLAKIQGLLSCHLIQLIDMDVKLGVTMDFNSPAHLVQTGYLYPSK